MTGASISSWREVAVPELGVILSAALDVFLEKGFHGASVREIAARAELTVPSLYYHHDSKEGLLCAVLMAGLTPIAQRVEDAAAEGATAAEKLSNVAECIALSMTVGARTAAIDMSEARYLSAENHARYVEVRDRIERQLQAILTEGDASGDFSLDDVSQTRRAILGMLQTIPRWYHITGSTPPEEIALHYSRLTLRLVGYSVR